MQRDWFSGLGSDGMDELMELAVEYAGGNHRWNSPSSVELAAQPDLGLPGLVVSLASSLLKLGLDGKSEVQLVYRGKSDDGVATVLARIDAPLEPTDFTREFVTDVLADFGPYLVQRYAHKPSEFRLHVLSLVLTYSEPCDGVYASVIVDLLDPRSCGLI